MTKKSDERFLRAKQKLLIWKITGRQILFCDMGFQKVVNLHCGGILNLFLINFFFTEILHLLDGIFFLLQDIKAIS